MRDRFTTKTFQSALKSYVGDTAQVFLQTIDRLDGDCYCCIDPKRRFRILSIMADTRCDRDTGLRQICYLQTG